MQTVIDKKKQTAIRDRLKKTFGERLRSLRKGKKISQQELAEILDTSYVTISRWETGLAFPEWDAVCRIADHFGVPLEFFRQESLSN